MTCLPDRPREALLADRSWPASGPGLGPDNQSLRDCQCDEWSVYRVDRSRGVKIQIDLHTRKVYYSDKNTPRRVPYNVIEA